MTGRTSGQGPNPARVRAVQQLRRSSAAGKHRDKRTRRARTREAATRRAVSDSDDE